MVIPARGDPGSSQPEESRRQSSATWLLYLAVLLASISVAQLLIRGGSLVGFQHELRYGEAVVLDQARRSAADPGLYPEIGKEPWLLDQYAPFYPWLAQLAGGFSSTPYGGGRAISLISTLVSALMLTLIVRRVSGLAAGLFCGATMLTMLEFLRFGFLMRVDPLALALALVGVWCTQDKSTRMRVLGAAAFFFAVYTRQTTVALLLASYAHLFLKEGRAALKWPVALLAVGLLFHGILSAATGGSFHHHAVTSNLFRFEWFEGMKKAFGYFIPWKLPLFFATFLALVPVGGGKNNRKMIFGSMAVALLLITPVLQEFFSKGAVTVDSNYMILYAHVVLLIAALLVIFRPESTNRIDGVRILLALASMVLIGRIGSDLNYLFEAGVLFLVVCGCSIGKAPPWRATTIFTLLAIQVVSGFYLSRGLPEFQSDRLDEIRYRQQVIDHLGRFEDPVLSEEPWALAEAGRPLVIEPFTARQMYESKFWDAKDLIAALDAQHYRAIVRAKQRIAAGYERDDSGKVIIGPDGNPRVYFANWTFNGVRSLPMEVQKAIERNYRAVPRTAMIERVTSAFLEGREIWEPIPR
ncbi:MAG: hypothetical protein VX404_04785 [Planctomycetota bacterium]|nr:hypothetical protein [Planctomycetota bacterium]